MATGAQAVERIAEATALLPAHVFRFARYLREADQDLWPEAGKGGGKLAAHVEQRHLVNLAIALAVDDPGDAVKAVPVYRNLVPNKANQHVLKREDIGMAASLLITHKMFRGRPLGSELDQLLDLLTWGDTAKILGKAGLYTEFFIEQLVPRVCVGYHTMDPANDLAKPMIELVYRKPDMPPGQARELAPYWNFLPLRRITRTALLPVSLFAVMAELWADTKRHHAETAARAVLVEE
jgi:hypothetical protein